MNKKENGCSPSVSDPFYHTEFTTVPTSEQAKARTCVDELFRFVYEIEDLPIEQVEAELREVGIDVDAFLKRCNVRVEECYQRAKAKVTLSDCGQLVRTVEYARQCKCTACTMWWCANVAGYIFCPACRNACTPLTDQYDGVCEQCFDDRVDT